LQEATSVGFLEAEPRAGTGQFRAMWNIVVVVVVVVAEETPETGSTAFVAVAAGNSMWVESILWSLVVEV